MGKEKSFHDPYYIFSLYNGFHLPKGWYLNLSFSYRSSGTYDFLTINSVHNFDFQLYKSFLKDKPLAKSERERHLQHHKPKDRWHLWQRAVPAAEVGRHPKRAAPPHLSLQPGQRSNTVARTPPRKPWDEWEENRKTF